MISDRAKEVKMSIECYAALMSYIISHEDDIKYDANDFGELSIVYDELVIDKMTQEKTEVKNESILEKLKDESVVSFNINEEERLITVLEECSLYYQRTLTKSEFGLMICELMALHDKMTQ